MLDTVSVELGLRSYPIFIGSGILSDEKYYLPYLDSTKVLVVTNTTIAPLYLDKVKKALSRQSSFELILPDGEQFKTIDTLNIVFSCLLENRFDRTSTLVALGGGVIGDIVGFAAACYQRGISFLQIPTTLLAQVDSSVGGKTGVNHPLGKNMIGAFHQPNCVIADTDTLNTLDDRQLAAGLAEVIKYGLVGDLDFFSWVEENVQGLLNRDPESLAFAIKKSCISKADIVAEDERESGKRALLNLGHTFGHAIENAMGYGNWLHGEAVSAGMCMAAELSVALGWLEKSELERIRRLLNKIGLPTQPPNDVPGEKLLELMSVDKKVLGGVQRLVLPKGLGHSVVTEEYDKELLISCVKGELA